MTYAIGNMLIATDVMKREPLVGLYFPLRLLVCESETDDVVVTYDLPSASLAQFVSPEVDGATPSVDARLEKLLDVAAALATKVRGAKTRPKFRVAEGSRR